MTLRKVVMTFLSFNVTTSIYVSLYFIIQKLHIIWKILLNHEQN